MRISCENCSSTYELDARLIPSVGAPVQCTRCGHVFTVLPDGSVVHSAPAPAFGAGTGEDPRRSGTQVFGVLPAPGEGPVREGTLVFGQAPGAHEPPREGTLVFGQARGAAPELEPRTSTQVFGAVALPELEPRTGTQVFGAVAPPLGAAPGSKTQVFGAVAPHPGEPPPSKTQVFGAVAPPPDEPPAPKTQIFGAASGARLAPELPPEGPLHKTLVFGAAAPATGTPPRTQTQAFGNASQAPAAPGAPKPSSTQMFGVKELEARLAQVPAPAPSGLDPAELFTPDLTVDVSEPLSEDFSALDAPSEAKTVPEGLPAQVRPGAVSPEQARTMPEVPAPDPFDELAREQEGRTRPAFPAMDFPPDVPGASQAQTLPDGLPQQELPAPRRTGEHVRMGVSTEGAGIPWGPLAPNPGAPRRTGEHARLAAPPAEAPVPRRTAEHARIGALDEIAAPMRAGEHGGLGASLGEAPTPRRTGEHARIELPPEPVAPRRTGEHAMLGALGEPPVRRTGEHMARRTGEHARPISLPPEAPSMLSGASAPDAIDEAALARFEARTRRRNRILAAVALLLVLGAGGLVVYRMDSARRTAVPQSVFNSLDLTLAQLRKDDEDSQEKAVARFAGILKEQPGLVEPRANLALALALRVDDTKLSIRRVELEAELLGRRMTKLQEEQSPSDWQNRFTAMQEQREALRAQMEPLKGQLRTLEARLTGVYKELPGELPPEASPREKLALARTQAVYFGVRGDAQTPIAAERYRVMGGKDGWDAIALAEYALNGRVADAMLTEAYKQLDVLIAADASFLRAYVLSARIAMQQKRYDAASNALDSTQALNPAHDLSLKLLSWTRQAQRSEAGQ